MQKGIIVFGVCHLTKGSLDIFEKNNVIVYCILEDDSKWHHTTIHNIPILGSTNNMQLLELLQDRCAAFIAYGHIQKRKSCLDLLLREHKAIPVSAVHPSANIASGVQLSQGHYIGAQVCLASFVKLGNYSILHNGVIIEEETDIHDWVEIGTGSIIGSNVTIEEGVFIGIGAKIISGITIKKGASIGPGSVVLENVKSNDVLIG